MLRLQCEFTVITGYYPVWVSLLALSFVWLLLSVGKLLCLKMEEIMDREAGPFSTNDM